MQEFQLHHDPTQQSESSMPSLWRGVISGSLVFLLLALLAVIGALLTYVSIASNLPSPGELENRISSFQNTRILDREGNLLTETFDPSEGRREEVPLNEISEYLQWATIATEDENFYKHRGVDPIALLRAVYYAIRERNLVSGASTIPQQLVKMVLLSPEQTITRKVNEAILSAEISRRYEKDRILELYLNEVYYGNLAYGAEAAASTYFNKDVADLTLGQASLMAGLPQLPAVYDPYANPERAKRRQEVVLTLMVKSGYITAEEADEAWAEPLSYVPLNFDVTSPHFTLFVRQELESMFGPESLYNTGIEVTTTLNPKLQAEAERIVREQIDRLAGHNASNGSLVSIRPETGEIVAFVGSADFDNVEIDGQVNMALSPRQPGSTMKSLVYLSAFEQPEKPINERWTPGTLVADIEEDFPDGANPPYRPTNYDKREHGMLTVRTALANSYNIPAVRAIQDVGIPSFLDTAKRLGITTLTREDYGLSLSLGSGEIPLLEMAGAYAVLANGGVRMPPIAIRKVVDADGRVVCELGTELPCHKDPTGIGSQAISAVDAFLVSDMLSDDEARAPVFGTNSILTLPDRPVAAKTGTTNDVRDVLTLGYTPQLATGVWVGNTDNSPMQNLGGFSGAAPIWNEFMQIAHENEPVRQFEPPPGVRQFEVCADTGTLPSPACPSKKIHWYAEDRPPLAIARDLYQIVRIDRASGELATQFTPPGAIEEVPLKVYPPEFREWAERQGFAQPPSDSSSVFTFAPEVSIAKPSDGETVTGIVTVLGSANIAAFREYQLQYGIGHSPQAFSSPFGGFSNTPVIGGILGELDTNSLQAGPYTLRILARDTYGSEYSTSVRLFVEKILPTATPLPTETWTPIPPTPTWTPVVAITATPLPTQVPTQIPVRATDTATPVPVESTATAIPPIIDTPIPVETPASVETPIPVETATETIPEDTPVVVETATPEPTATLVVIPTEIPPTATPFPEPPSPTPTTESVIWTPTPDTEESGG